MRRTSSIISVSVVCMLIVLFMPLTRTHANPPRCFDATGYCIEGRFREYWEQNGGLPVFGYPITAPAEEVNPTDGGIYLTQWFERNRFEYHPKNAPPYDVLLGLLGSDRLTEMNRIARPNQYPIHWRFAGYWRSHGLEFGDPGMSERESLALFGYPITAAQMETSPTDGRDYLTQWFERARFEYHPENAPPHDILLGLLGSELQQQAPVAPTFTAQPSATRTATNIPTATRRSNGGGSSPRKPAPTRGQERTSTPVPPAALPSPEPSRTPTQTITPTHTALVPTPLIGTPPPIRTRTPTNTPTAQAATPTATSTTPPTTTATLTTSSTPTPAGTDTPTPAGTRTPTANTTPTEILTPTPTPAASSTPTPAGTSTPTASPTPTETPTPPPAASSTPTQTRTRTPTTSATPIARQAARPTPTETRTPIPDPGRRPADSP